ncbi:MAG: PEP-utilizing enzyme [Candidatus Woesearchaeota archaeon]
MKRMPNFAKVKAELQDIDPVIQSAKTAMTSCDIAFVGYAHSDVYGKSVGSGYAYLIPRTNFQFYQINPKSNFDRLSRHVYQAYMKDSTFVASKLAKMEGLNARLKRSWLLIRKSPVVTYKLFDEHVELFREWWKYALLAEDKGNIIDELIIPKLAAAKHISVRDATELVKICTQKPSVFSQERSEFLNLCLLKHSRASALFEKRLAAYLKNYFWIKTDFFESFRYDQHAVEQAIERELKKFGVDELKAELTLLKEKQLEQLHKHSRIKLSQSSRKDMALASQIISFVDKRKSVMMQNFFYFFHILSRVANQTKISCMEIKLYTVDELKAVLRTGRKLSSRELSRRKKGVFIVYAFNKPAVLFTGKEARELFSIISHSIKTSFLQGQVASTGGNAAVKGRVKIIRDAKNQPFPKDAILVTSMTRVEFIPLMRRAKAVITDEGGLACHAAIVSRELGIPCIIGAKNATRLLKDQDLIEMNMATGSIKVLSGPK